MRIGIDLGGTKTEGVVLDEGGGERVRRRVSTPAGDYGAILETVRDLVLDLEAQVSERCTVGVGTPGAISPATGALRNSNTTCLNGARLEEDLARVLERPVRLSNDANCFALSEAVDGAGAGAEVVFGVILGTGVGGGVVFRGKVLTGLHAIAGEWGHNPLPGMTPAEWPGPPCYCGRRGCLETWLSGPGLAADAAGSEGPRLEPPQIVARAVAGDEGARAALERHQDRLARGLAAVINLLDPEVIVLGGGLSNLEHLYTGVPARWERHVFSDHVRTRLLPPRHGDSGGVRGAAWLWPPRAPPGA